MRSRHGDSHLSRGLGQSNVCRCKDGPVVCKGTEYQTATWGHLRSALSPRRMRERHQRQHPHVCRPPQTCPHIGTVVVRPMTNRKTPTSPTAALRPH